jgi:hypothetical protein
VLEAHSKRHPHGRWIDMSLQRVGVAASVGAASIVIALTAAAQAAIPTRNWTQTPANEAGVKFHPYGDYFEIWDNYADGRRVQVRWNYVGIRDRWKKVYSARRHGLYRVNMAERPHRIYFRVLGYSPGGLLAYSRIVKYRTWGK